MICGLFNDAVRMSDYTASDDKIINEHWIGKDTEGSDGSLIQGAVLSFACETDENHEKLVRINSFRAEIWTRDLLNMK